MRYRPPELKERFKAFKSGDDEALEYLLDSEKIRLFDFIMRMTGQISRSLDVAHETLSSVIPVADQEDSLDDLLVVVFKTARNFSLDMWNADTSRLENAAYAQASQLKTDKLSGTLVALEQIIRSLPPKQREILLLHERFGFSPDEIADITSYPLGDVEEIFANALGVTEAALTGESEKVPELMIKLLPFPMPEPDDQVTQNLSIVFKDLKKSSKKAPGGVIKLFMWFVIAAVISTAAVNYDLILKIMSEWLRP
jgi:DNA-directed RNA polymerase specialized sigma24 family protein